MPRLCRGLDKLAAHPSREGGPFGRADFSLLDLVCLVADEDDGDVVCVFDPADLVLELFDPLERRALRDRVDDQESVALSEG